MNAGRIHPRAAVYVALFSGVTAVSAFIKIPLPWVPLTLQTAAVLLSGVLLGPRYGALSQLVYVVTGLLGFPVFAQGGGIGYVLNPTFGYLFGFAPAAGICGAVTGDWRRASMPRIAGALLAGLGIIYLTGIIFLHWNMTFVQEKNIPFVSLLKVGLLIPLPGDLMKILCLLPLIKILKRREHLLPAL